MDAAVILLVAFLAGSIPFSNIVAVRAHGVDLREVHGTVSGTALYHLAGFGALALAGIFDVAKGVVGPVLAGPHEHPVLAACAAAATLAGHNWSPFLRGAGGRGFAPSLGALLVIAWPGTLILLASLIIGVTTRNTGIAMFVGVLVLTPVLAVTHGWGGALGGIAIAVPMFTKRVLGNHRAPAPRLPTSVCRLLFDRDDWPTR